MPIRLDKFGGLIPRMAPALLPDSAAQVAHNVDLTGGAIRPLRIGGPFSRMHEENGRLVKGVPESDVKKLFVPEPPVITLPRLCQPIPHWLIIKARDWMTWIDDETGVRQIVKSREETMPILDWWYTETGMDIIAGLTSAYYEIASGPVVSHRGPMYQFLLAQDATGEFGGPDRDTPIPYYYTEADDEIPRNTVPLYNSDRNLYGHFQVVDVHGPKFDEDYVVDPEDYDFIYFYAPSTNAAVHFTINLNFAEPRRRHVYYCWSAMTSDDEEGPPSDITNRVIVPPGCSVQAAITGPGSASYTKGRLYRSGTGGDDFSLVKEFDLPAATVVDRLYQGTGDEIPPFGNYPGSDKDLLLEGSVLHPAQFAAAIWDQDLRFSDQYRLYAWPGEFSVPFTEDPRGLALVGNTVLVWAGDRVYAVTGSHPEHMSSYLLSETARLLSKHSICRIGDTVYYATDDGLAAATAGGVQIVSKEFFNREQWTTFGPEDLWASTADGALLLEVKSAGTYDGPGTLRKQALLLRGLGVSSSDTVNLVWRFGEGESTLATYSALEASMANWQSKDFLFAQPTRFDWIRLAADGAVTVTPFCGGNALASFEVRSNRPVKLPSSAWGTRWSWGLKTADSVSRFEAFEQITFPILDTVSLTPANTPLFREVRLQFQSVGQVAAARLNFTAGASARVQFFADGAAVGEAIEVMSGRAFLVPRAGRPEGCRWMADIQAADGAAADIHVDQFDVYAERVKTLDADVREVNEGVPGWLFTTYQAAAGARLASVLVYAAAEVKCYVTTDGVRDDGHGIAWFGEVRLGMAFGRRVQLDFDGFDHLVREVQIMVARPIALGDEPYTVPLTGSTRGLWFRFAEPNRIAGVGITAADGTEVNIIVQPMGGSETAVPMKPGFYEVDRNLGVARDWFVDLEITSGGPVYAIDVYPLRTERVEAPRLAWVHGDGRVPAWRYTRYVMPSRNEITSVFLGGRFADLTFYLDGEETDPVLIAADMEIPLDDLWCTEFEVRGAEDADGLRLYFRDVQTVQPGGLQLDGRENWRRLFYRFVDLDHFVVARVGATGPVTLKLKIGDAELYSRVHNDGKAVLLDRHYTDVSIVEVDAEAGDSVKIESITLLTREIVQAQAVISEARAGGIPRWMYGRYVPPQNGAWVAAQVAADMIPVGNLTMNVYLDGEAEASLKLPIETDEPVPLPAIIRGRSVDFDFAPNDNAVRLARLFSSTARPVGPDGIILSNEPYWAGILLNFEDLGRWAAMSVAATAYTIQAQFYAEGCGLVHTQAVTDGGAIRLPRTMPGAGMWRVDFLFSAGTEIHQVVLKPLIDQAVEGTLYLTAEPAIPRWLYTRYHFAGITKMVSVWGEGAATQAWLEGAVNTSVDFSSTETAADVTVGDYLEVHFGGADDTVVSFCINAREAIPVADTPVFVPAKLPRHWVGRMLSFSNRGRIRAMRVCPGGEVKLWSGNRKWTWTSDGTLFRVPGAATLPTAPEWRLDIMGMEQIDLAWLYPERRVPVEGNVIYALRPDPDVAPWWYTIWEFADRVPLRSAKYNGSAASVTISIYVNGSETPTVKTLYKGVETALPATLTASDVRVAFSDDQGVTEFFLFGEERVPIDNGSGVVVRAVPPGMGWMNKTVVFPETGRFSVVRIAATAYPVTLSLNGVSHVIANEGDMALSTSENAREWPLAISGAGLPEEVVLIAFDETRLETPLISITRDQDPFSWLAHRFVLDAPSDWNCARVMADIYPIELRLLANEALKASVIIRDARPVRLPKMRPERRWRVDLMASPAAGVRAVAVARSMGDLGRVT